MDEFLKFIKNYKYQIIGAIIAIIILWSGLYKVLLWVAVIGIGIYIGYYIQRNREKVKEKLKKLIDKI